MSSGTSCTIMRGGTSKGLFFLESDLPNDPEARTQAILRAFGSPDPRQIDGLGGADPLTSKLAIIRASERPDIDIDYTFGQVSITEATIDSSANCGNISSAVGPFAIDKGLTKAIEPVTQVRIFNTNTGKVIVAEVPVSNGQVVSAGEYRIDGVPGSGAEIRLHFVRPEGAATGKLLPTGRSCDAIRLEDGRTVDLTIIDAGNPTAFALAEQLGLTGSELPDELNAREEYLNILEELRSKVSETLGFTDSWKDSFHRYSSIPKIAFVAKPERYKAYTGQSIAKDQIDLRARVLSMGRPHKAFAVTVAIPLAAASRLPGSVVHQVCQASGNSLRIGHPSGTMEVEVVMDPADGQKLQEVIVGRTARKLMEGRVFL